MTRASLSATAACLFLATALLGGCATSSDAAKTQGTGVVADLGDPVDLVGKTDVTIEVVDNAFVARVIKVSPGATITFKNTGFNLHNVTANTDGDFEPLVLNPGQTATLVAPSGAKTVRFYCSIHAGKDAGVQRGAIVVGTASSGR